jgi:hypothetical protein
MSTPAPSPIPSSVILNGGQSLKVTKLDGTTEEVVIRLVPLSQLADYFNKLDHMDQFIEFIVKKDKGYADTLTDDSQFAIDRIAKELNSFRMGRYLQRQVATQKETVERIRQITGLQISAPTASPAG